MKTLQRFKPAMTGASQKGSGATYLVQGHSHFKLHTHYITPLRHEVLMGDHARSVFPGLLFQDFRC